MDKKGSAMLVIRSIIMILLVIFPLIGYSQLFKQPLSEFRQIDGHDNNQYGASEQPFRRLLPAAYSDGLNQPAGMDRPSARDISFQIFSQYESIPNRKHRSNMLWLWGQFIDHDIDLTAEPFVGEDEWFPIAVPQGDPYFDPFKTGQEVIGFIRSGFDHNTGQDGIPRQQVNEITAFLDASMIYGSDSYRAAFVRDVGGKLKTSAGDLLPYNDGSQTNAGGPGPGLFVAGDVRANENVVLTIMHTIFVREHNYWVDKIKQHHPEYSDEMLYQHAKAIVEAQIQAITYNEFLPALMGKKFKKKHYQYHDDLDPQISNSFASAGFRLGHTLLSSSILRLHEDGSSDIQGPLLLQDAFFHPELLQQPDTIETVLRGMSASYAQEVDAKMITDVQNFLFGPPGAGGFDLAALNIQRGRDHGLPDYLSARQLMGLKTKKIPKVLRQVYDHDYQIDLFVGGLSEKHVHGAMIGETFYQILHDQFYRLRSADRFWYGKRLPKKLVKEINRTKLSDIIKRNTNIKYLQHDVFNRYQRKAGNQYANYLTGSKHKDLIMGYAGNDKISAGKDNDQLYGGDDNDHLRGEKGHDHLYGEYGDDLLIGGPGNDVLNGGPGFDLLIGGPGKDVFVSEPGSLVDVIFDLQAKDKIDLRAHNISYKQLKIRRYRHKIVITLPSQDRVIIESLRPRLERSHFKF